MRNIKARTLWISVVISFLIAAGLIVAVTQTSGIWTNVLIVLIAITFIYTTIAIQIASTKSFRYKAKSKIYHSKTYLIDIEGMDERLKKIGYQPRITPYGVSYLKVRVPNAFKIVIISNPDKYFNQEEERSHSSNKSLEKCQKFIGCEIFIKYNDEVLNRLPDFNIQGEKIYYGGYYLENNKLICPNFLEPNENFKDVFGILQGDLDWKEETLIEQE